MNRINLEFDVTTASTRFVRRMLCGCSLLSCIIVVSSCKETQSGVRKYDNGFFMTSRDADDGISRKTLWHLNADKGEQVAEFIVISNNVVTFMPTIIQKGDCVPQSLDIRNVIRGKFTLGGLSGDFTPFTIRVDSDTATFKRILKNHGETDMTLDKLKHLSKRLIGFSTNTISVLEIGTPCRFELVDTAIAELSRFSGGGISIVPYIHYAPVSVPHHELPKDLNDMKVDPHSL